MSVGAARTRRSRGHRAAGIAAVLVALCVVSACVTITRPTKSSTITGSTVVADVSFRTPYCSGFSAQLDGNDVTQSFNPQTPGMGSTQATLSGVAPGSHTLVATAQTQQYWLLIPYCAAETDSVTFTTMGAPTPALGFSPAGPLSLTAGSASNVRVTVSPAQASAATVSLASSSAAATVPASTTIGANASTSAPVAISAQAAGTASVTASAAGFQSGAITVNVTAPVNPATVLFRGTNTRIEIIRFTPGTPFSSGAFQLLGSVAATSSPGMLSVALCRDAARLARIGASDAQLFTIGGTAANPTLTLAASTPLPSGLTGVGTACAFLPTALVRGTDTGLETLDPATAPIAKLGSVNAGFSSIGVALAGDAPRLWRSHSTGLETYDVTNRTMPTLTSNVITNMTGSSTGTALAWLATGTTLVRATSLGVDVIDVSAASPARLGFLNTGGASAAGVAVAVTGTRAVRATDFGIEVYELGTPGTPVRCASRNAGLSSTGVGVAIRGGVAFRATNSGIEAYDISDPACPTPPATLPAPVVLQTGLGASASGVALVTQ